MTSLSRSLSEPVSLSSGGDEAVGADLLDRTRQSIATLQHALAASRDRCRRLEAQVKNQTTSIPTNFDAVGVQQVSENRRLRDTVSRQYKTICKLRRRLRMVQRRPEVDDSSVCSGDVDDSSDSMSDFEMLSLHDASTSHAADNCQSTVDLSENNSFVM